MASCSLDTKARVKNLICLTNRCPIQVRPNEFYDYIDHGICREVINKDPLMVDATRPDYDAFSVYFGVYNCNPWNI